MRKLDSPTKFSLQLVVMLAAVQATFVNAGAVAVAQASAATQTSAAAAEATEDEAREQKVNDRYLQLLKRSPRKGTSLDRIYGFHVDRGTLDAYLKSLADEVAAGDPDGGASMILGMMEMRRGRDAASKNAFEKAEQLRPTDAIASWYLGQALIATGETYKAIEALERSISRDPAKADQLEIFQTLGRIYQRSQKTEQALDLWKRFEAAFPDDERVQEQIATTLIEENELPEALKRLEALQQNATDPYRKVQFAIQAAELKLKLGQQEQALADFEEQLQQLKPSSWLFNDVRSKIEASFLRTDDYAGLVSYYEGWMTSHPDDLDAMARIGKYLAIQGRADAARQWYEKAIAKGPSDAKLRLALIEQLIADGKYAEAIKQYEQLVEFDPGNPDHIERWGMLYLKHEDLSEQQRTAKAAEIWNSLLKQKPDDAVVVSRVADLFRAASMTDEALTLYKRCIELAPENPQYREYLGEYYHILQRPEDAKSTWQQMVAGDLRTTQNLVRLSEVYKGFGYKDEAMATMEDACKMDPDFSDLIRFSNMLRDAKRFDDSLAQLDKAETLVASPDETQIILEERIKSYLEGGQLTRKTEELISEIGDKGTSDQWRILALYQEALSLLPDASTSAKQAVQLAPESIPAWAVVARVTEKAGLLTEASAANNRLTQLDRRYKTEYLKKIADLERRLGRLDDALQAGKDLIAAAPGNPENYQFYADLCFQLGKPELGLDALRRSVRVNPSDVGSLMGLARALAEQFQTPEAIELYWRAFQKAEGLDDQIKVVQTLTELYLRTDTFDRLISRLENMAKELNQQRDMTICLANCYQTAGDIGMATEVLQSLVSENTSDVLLLDELAKLSEQAEEYAEAVEYQKQLVALTKSPDAEARLANLLIRSGDPEAAEALWEKALNTNAEPHRLIKSIDGLITADKLDAATKLCEQLLSRNNEDWEVLLRLAVIDWKQDKKESAIKRCEQILALKLDDDAPSHETRFNQSQRTSFGSGSKTTQTRYPAGYPQMFVRMQIIAQLIPALNLSSGRNFGGLPAGVAPWTVNDFASCRYLALTIEMGYATEQNRAEERLEQLWELAESSIEKDAQPAWDYFVSGMYQQYSGNTDPGQMWKAGELLVKRSEPEAKLVYLMSLQQRSRSQIVQGVATAEPAETLSEEQLDLMLDAWNVVNNAHPEWATYTGGLTMVITELENAGKTEKADSLFQNLIRPDASLSEVSAAAQLATTRGDVDQMLELTLRIAKLEQAQVGSSTRRTNTLAQLGISFSQMASKMAGETKDWADLDKLVTGFLKIKGDAYNSLTAARGGNLLNAASASTSSGFSSNSHHQVFSNGSQASYRQVETLPANKFLSNADVTFLVNLHVLYTDRLPELRSMLARYRKAAEGTAAVMAELAIAHIEFLAGAKEQAAVHLVRAAALEPDDVSLRLNLVQYYQAAGNNADALQLLDTIEAVDQGVMKDREQLALALATSVNNIDRAKLAAERLFGLRLDANFAMQLSTQMQQLGMTEMSEALLARTRRTAGNDVGTLLTLMNGYRSKGDDAVAAQIAHQIMRKTSSRSAGSSNSRDSGTLTNARTAAVAILGKNGQLDSMIDRVKDQLARSPKSIDLHRTLEEYYTAAGQTKEAAEVSEQLAALQPANVDTLIRMAQQLERSRNYSEACDKYLLVFEKDTTKFSQNYYQYLRTFQNAKRLGDLADMMIKSDLKKFQNNYYVITEVVQYLFRESARGNNAGSAERKKGLELFAAAWEAMPTSRSYMLSNISDHSIWQTPEMLNYAKEGMVPATLQQSVAQPWSGIADSMSYDSNGMVTGTLTRVCDGLKTPESLQEFTDIVEAGVEKYTSWHGGKVVLCALKAKNKHVDEAIAILDQLKADKNVQYLPTNVVWILSCILEPVDPRFDPYMLEFLEQGLEKDPNSNRNSNGFSYSPWRRLAVLHNKAGNRSKARSLVHKAVKTSDVSNIASNNPGYQEYQDLQNYQGAAAQLLEFGFPFDAIEMYKRITPELVAAGSRWGGSSSRAVEQARTAEKQAIAKITPEAVLDYLQVSTEAVVTDDSEKNTESSRKPSGIDLMLTAPDDGVDGKISSVVLDGLLAANLKAGKDVSSISEVLLKYASEPSLHGPSAAIAVVAVGNKFEDSELLTNGFKRLGEYLKATTAEEVNTSDVGLWIAARIALQSDSTKQLGSELAERAKKAAEAGKDDRWIMAMMKERGDMAIAAGNKPEAEQAWTRLLDAVLADASIRSETSSSAIKESGTSTKTGKTGSALQELRDKLLNKPTTIAP